VVWKAQEVAEKTQEVQDAARKAVWKSYGGWTAEQKAWEEGRLYEAARDARAEARESRKVAMKAKEVVRKAKEVSYEAARKVGKAWEVVHKRGTNENI
jgi:hypothetical protein